jgi:hypothetical protein
MRSRRDSFGKKHYKLRTHHLKALIDFVEQGNILQSHDDVPEDIREQLLAEEQQQLERQSKLSDYSTPSLPPINITNVLPLRSMKRLQLVYLSQQKMSIPALQVLPL